MPHIINTKDSKYIRSFQSLTSKKINYKYPDNLDLHPSSPLHSKLVSLIIERANDASTAIASRRVSWKKIEQSLTSYIPLDEAEKAVKDKDSRKPMRVVIPISFATIETLLTYWVSAFLTNPIFKFEGYGPEDSVGAMMMESTIQQNAVKSRMGLALHTWWRDGLSAGFGAATPMWYKSDKLRKIKKKQQQDEQGMYSRIKNVFIPQEETYTTEEVPEWEGSILYNIDYRNFLPDPTVPVYEVHKGEASGWIRRSNFMTMYEEELASEGEIFNVEYLKDVNGESALFDSEGSTGRANDNNKSAGYNHTTKVLDTIYYYMKIIPFDLDIGDSKTPEIWLMALTADKVITQLHKVNNNHGHIPIVVNAPDYDGHTLLPMSRMETIYGLQQSMDWLFDSHITNVRKSLNDMFIVDPSIINMHDLTNPGPGKLIRLRRSVWGRGVKDAVMQLPVNDITRNNMADTGMIMDLVNRTSAASDSVQGMIRKGSERRSAAEFSGTMTSALSRIEKTARITWMQGMLPLQEMLASDTQQYMSGEQYVRLNKGQQQMLTENMQSKVFESRPGNFKIAISPDDLDYSYDIIPHDGSMPGAGDVQTWTQIFQIAASSEQVGQRLDIYKIFKHLAQISGAKNIEDFEAPQQIQSQVMPDEQVQQQVQAGNYVPVE